MEVCAHTTCTVQSSMRALVCDAEVSDVKLEGTDGKVVPAIKALMAARSEVFRRMFFGQFAESAAGSVALGYSSDVIRCIVKYCYTDDVDVSSHLQSCPEEVVRLLVRLASAADYYGLSGLEVKASHQASALMTDHPSLACAILDEARTGHNDGLGRFALEIIRVRSEHALLLPENGGIRGGGVVCLSENTLREVLQDQELQADEFTLFRSLEKWARKDEAAGRTEPLGELNFNTTDEPADDKQMRKAGRIAIAKTMAHYIDLSRIAPSTLDAYVANSSIVTADQIHDAFRRHALKLEKEAGFTAEKRSLRNSGGCVMIKGAGSQEVNGTYSRCRGDSRCYVKEGARWKGHSGFFNLAPFDTEGKWYIGFIPTDQGATSIHIFYEACMGENDTKAVPRENWARAVAPQKFSKAFDTQCEGREPAPLCFTITASDT